MLYDRIELYVASDSQILMAQDNAPIWFITGCSTGFGKELAKLVLLRGWRAVVTARNPEQIRDIVGAYPDTALPLPLDVTQRSSIEKAVQHVQDRWGSVDVLVNNAGYGYMAAVEEGEDPAVRQLFETNFFGLVDLTKKVLPGMRKRRSGFIVNVSSIGGLLSFPATGYYHATKYAVEGISESLAAEVAPLGIKVMIVEPGPFRTDWLGRSLVQSEVEIPDYDTTVGERKRQRSTRSGKQEGDPVRASQAIIDAVSSPNPPLRLLLGRMALDLAHKKLDSLGREFEAWRETTLGADYPAGE